ncbi:MAG: inositol monophosphatase family protein [bacterium]|nr:inositol monophosphatase family protein [bacterium]
MLQTAIKAAKEAEKIILGYYDQVLKEERKADHTLVTVADKNAEGMIREIILADYPNHKILGEEEGQIGVGDSEYLWIVDPIDGTTNYHSHIPMFATSIALYKNKEPLLAVINLPAWDKMITAEKGKGTFLNGKRIHVSEKDELEYSLLSFGYGPGEEVRKKTAEIFSRFITKTRTARIFGSQVVQGALVAIGETEAFISTGASKWDYAATSLAVIEAGGLVTDLAGKIWTIDSTEFVAAGPKLHPKIIEVIGFGS